MKIIEYTPKIVATNEDDIIPLLNFIYNNFSFGSIGVEFGSGHTSTYILGEKFMLTSFEESQDFMHLRYRTRLIYSTLIDGWFELGTVKRMIPKKWKFCLIDAPMNEDFRHNILRCSDLFEKNGVIICNIKSQKDFEIYMHLANKLKKSFREYSIGNCRFCVLGISPFRLFFRTIGNFLRINKKRKISIELNHY